MVEDGRGKNVVRTLAANTTSSDNRPMENQNPYAAPQEIGLNEPDAWVSPPPNPIASADERVTTLIVDGILLGVVFLVLVSLAADSLTEFYMGCLTTAGIGFFYYYAFELKFGKTIGKMFSRTRVLTRDGQKPNSKQILKRTFARLIPFDVFFFLGEVGHPIGLHDSLSETVVVSDKRWTGNCTWLHFDGNEGFSDTSQSSSEKYASPFRTQEHS